MPNSRYVSRLVPGRPNTATSAAAPRDTARHRNPPRPNASEPTATSDGNNSGFHHDASIMGRKFSAAAYAQRANPPSVTSPPARRQPTQAANSRGQQAHEPSN